VPLSNGSDAIIISLDYGSVERDFMVAVDGRLGASVCDIALQGRSAKADHVVRTIN
jgi:hypothetical protein